MQAEAAGVSPPGAAERVLEKQERLIGWEIADRIAGLTLKLAIGAAALALAAAIGLAAWSASQASGTVIEPFDSAPALVAQGLGGEAIANELVSRVTAMQYDAGNDRPRRESSSGADRINVVIPQTGISIGEAQRLLREWLGHETHVSGGLRPTPDGKLALSLRVDGRSVPVTPPPADQLGSADAWIGAGAQAALRETDPYRYATWLINNSQADEAAGLYRRLSRTGSAADRAWAWIGLGNVFRGRGDLAGALDADRWAVTLAPDSDSVLVNVASTQRYLGHDELARADMLAALRVPGHRSWRPIRVAARAMQAASWRDDWLTAASQFESVLAAVPPGATQGYPPGLVIVYGRALARLHEPQRAMRFTPDIPPLSGSLQFEMRATQLAEAGHWPELEALAAQPFRLPASVAGIAPQLDRTLRQPWLAYAMAHNGKTAEARQILSATPLDCYLCLRTRGEVAALAGDAGEADRWFAEAVRQGPSLADADQEWAQARLARGDLGGALALARQASRKAPAWADPLKLEGDVLARQGDLEGAVRVYNAAEPKAPGWGGLRLAHGEALARLRLRPAALAQWRDAARRELAPAERSRVQALLGTPAV